MPQARLAARPPAARRPGAAAARGGATAAVELQPTRPHAMIATFMNGILI